MKNPAWSVKKVEPHSDYTLKIWFEDDKVRIYDAKPLLEKPVYASLRDLSVFMKARAFCGSVAWSNDVDIAPEYLYENSVPYEDE